MFTHTPDQGLPLRRTRLFRLGVVAAGALFVVSTVPLSAQRRNAGGSARQSRQTSQNVGANKNNNYNRNVNRNTNVNRTTVNRNTNVNVNRNVNVNTRPGYRPGGTVIAGEEGAVAVGRRGAVAVGEEGAAAVGRRGAVVAGEEGFVGVGRYGAVVGGERYESYEGWRAAAGVATGIAIGTMLARPPTASVTVVTGGTNYMYADGAYFEQVYYGGQVSYRVVTAPAGAVITTLPGGCTTTIMNGVTVTQCGATYYRRVSTGYQVVVF
jgi:hypothetical protein